MALVPLLLVALGVLATAPLVAHHEPARRALALRRAGLGWMVAVTVLGGLFAAGETFADPGGWAAAGLVAAWVVPMVALSLVAWSAPRMALPLLTVLVVAGLVVALFAEAFHGRGPVVALSMFALGLPLALLGWRRPRPAGWLLVASSALPTVFLVLGTSEPLHAALGGSTAAGTLPLLVTGVLYLLADRFERETTAEGEPPARPEHEAVGG